ncbi:MAG: hypothetical protein Q4G18_03285 [Myroides sp.]|nr:hypothetical protein [Myroides sp.]
MKEAAIKEMFDQAIQERGVYTLLNVSRSVVSDWKTNRTKPSLGTMIEVLYRLDQISIIKNEHNR